MDTRRGMALHSLTVGNTESEDEDEVSRLPFPDSLPDGPVKLLLRELHNLHARAGWPSTRTMAQGQKFSHTVVHELFTISDGRPPKLPVLLDVVAVLAEMAPRANPDEVLDRFDSLWLAATAHPQKEVGESIQEEPQAELSSVSAYLRRAMARSQKSYEEIARELREGEEVDEVDAYAKALGVKSMINNGVDGLPPRLLDKLVKVLRIPPWEEGAIKGIIADNQAKRNVLMDRINRIPGL